MQKCCQYKPNNIPDNTSGNIVEIIDNVGLQGAKGDSGLTPYIGENQHWWIGTEDTGVQAEGVVGVSACATKDDFPEVGKTTQIYLDISDNSIYRWDEEGQEYVAISMLNNDVLIAWATDYFGNKEKDGYALIKDAVENVVEEETVPIMAAALKDEDKDEKTQQLAGTISDYHLKDKNDTYSGISIDKLDTEDLILTANTEA